MLARELAEQVPTVTRQTTGAEAARVAAEYRLSGLVVTDHAGIPTVVIPGSQILGLILPAYLRDDPGLAHAFDEGGADQMCARLNDTTIGQLLDAKVITPKAPARVFPDDTLVELASIMVEGRHPMVLVIDHDGTYRGTIMTSRVLAAIASLAGQDSQLVRRRLERDVIRSGDPWLPEDPAGVSEESGPGDSQ
ncbi:MAG: CBS domain-containing protein [Candidatus Phosphoribacter sp.]